MPIKFESYEQEDTRLKVYAPFVANEYLSSNSISRKSYPVYLQDDADSSLRNKKVIVIFGLEENSEKPYTYEIKEGSRSLDSSEYDKTLFYENCLIEKPACLEGFESFFESGWDGFEADPISPHSLDIACKIIKRLPYQFQNPDTAPAADGSVCMEWVFDNGQEIFIDVGPNELILTYAKFKNGREMKKRFETISSLAIDYIISVFRNLEN